MAQPRMRISAMVLGAPDPQALGAFCARLLGWTVVENQPVWVMVRPPSGGTGLSFRTRRITFRRLGRQRPASSR